MEQVGMKASFLLGEARKQGGLWNGNWMWGDLESVVFIKAQVCRIRPALLNLDGTLWTCPGDGVWWLRTPQMQTDRQIHTQKHHKQSIKLQLLTCFLQHGDVCPCPCGNVMCIHTVSQHVDWANIWSCRSNRRGVHKSGQHIYLRSRDILINVSPFRPWVDILTHKLSSGNCLFIYEWIYMPEVCKCAQECVYVCVCIYSMCVHPFLPWRRLAAPGETGRAE